MSSGFITRVEHDKDEPYTVIFTTDDERKYKAIEDACRCAIGHGKPQFQEVVHGEWIGVAPDMDTVQCSVCGYNLYSEELETPYCPWCGAKMKGDNDADS